MEVLTQTRRTKAGGSGPDDQARLSCIVMWRFTCMDDKAAMVVMKTTTDDTNL